MENVAGTCCRLSVGCITPLLLDYCCTLVLRLTSGCPSNMQLASCWIVYASCLLRTSHFQRGGASLLTSLHCTGEFGQLTADGTTTCRSTEPQFMTSTNQ
jgi:hypothetical protein